MLRIAGIVLLLMVGGSSESWAGDKGQESLLQSKEIVVHKTPWCGCCNNWVLHLRHAGAVVTVHDHEDLTQIKNELLVAAKLQSCHTAEVEGYVIEGHVPIEDISRLLTEKPEALGIAVPGMPMGSPGMEMGNHKDAYEVILFKLDGSQEIYSRH